MGNFFCDPVYFDRFDKLPAVIQKKILSYYDLKTKIGFSRISKSCSKMFKIERQCTLNFWNSYDKIFKEDFKTVHQINARQPNAPNKVEYIVFPDFTVAKPDCKNTDAKIAMKLYVDYNLKVEKKYYGDDISGASYTFRTNVYISIKPFTHQISKLAPMDHQFIAQLFGLINWIYSRYCITIKESQEYRGSMLD